MSQPSVLIRSGTKATLAVGAITALVLAIRAALILGPAHDYDEGVYWQSLLAMSDGHALYRDIFYSQPPLFLIVVYGFFVAFGKTLVAARIAMVLSSAVNLAAMSWIGFRLAGRTGMVAALVLLGLNYFDLRQAISLEAEAPALALSTLSVALSLEWYERRGSPRLVWLACGAGAAAGAAVLCKLLVVACLLPFCTFAVARRDWRGLVAFTAGAAVIFALILARFADRLPQLVTQTIAFHVPVGKAFAAEEVTRWPLIASAFLTPLAALALAGVIGAVYLRDVRGAALVLWLCGVVAALSRVTPLWGEHHLSALQPPLIALGVYGWNFGRKHEMRPIALAVTLTLFITIIFQAFVSFYSLTSLLKVDSHMAIVRDLRRNVPQTGWVVTDGQAIAAAAGRQTPPFLVDTSLVRIRSGYLTSAEMIQQTNNPQVRAVLIASSRFHLPQMRLFRDWLAHHFRRYARYSRTEELWVR